MKSWGAVGLLMMALSFPALAGHTQIGDLPFSCGTPGGVQDDPCECGNVPVTDHAPKGLPAEWGSVFVAVLLWLRLKA